MFASDVSEVRDSHRRRRALAPRGHPCGAHRGPLSRLRLRSKAKGPRRSTEEAPSRPNRVLRTSCERTGITSSRAPNSRRVQTSGSQDPLSPCRWTRAARGSVRPGGALLAPSMRGGERGPFTTREGAKARLDPWLGRSPCGSWPCFAAKPIFQRPGRARRCSRPKKWLRHGT